MTSELTGSVFDIKKYTIHDGPGIRTTVFFKGCPLACQWCHNPESLSVMTQRVFRHELCIGCRECCRICPQNAIYFTDTGAHFDPAKCDWCRICVDNCPSEALEFIGRTVSVDEVMEQIVKDVPFYDESKGGVTFSGGEPLMQPEFLLALLESCGKLDIHRTVDTAGYADTQKLLAIADLTELFLYDLKHMDPQRHKQHTGVSNRLILDNLRRLAQTGVEINIRIPVIPGINDDDANIDRTGDFISALKVVRDVSLLPFHTAARHKYDRLGQEFRFVNLSSPSDDQIRSIAERLQKFGLQVKIGG
jgi:pyruvate formate lyase activating enzyme